ncbi:MAG TPA: SDR family oxidoreductase [Planctomycetota bacterium]|mgnify:CR=1 FL=1|nr:SDR family oxidoreductase [Planctomycetota bacterium]HRR81295.1 SDR family oxidoreductase [Planctomycetota bacterium]HRT95999.1 SDR family oxidoreductase [Planctomycetota bacterium]
MPDLAPFSLAGRVALVTGASRGIGRACALGLARAGADVALVARDPQALASVASEIQAYGRKTFTRVADLASPMVCDAVVADCSAALGTIDTLLYGAGVTRRAPAQEVELGQIDDCLAVNTKSAFATAQAIGRRLLAARKPGSLIFIASLMSRGARPTTIPYGISKMALTGVVRGLATEWAPNGIRANAIAPGYVRTDLAAKVYDDPILREWVTSRIPQGRWQEPEDYAPIAVFLASEASRIITGQIIFADGGWTAAL